MPKVGMGPIRRSQLINATFDAVFEFGLSETTIARIAKKADVSTGIISHYFGGKNGLIEASMREILKNLRISVAQGSAKAKTPQEKIEAIINGNFSSAQRDPKSVTIWLAFWSEAMHVPELNRLQSVNKRRLYSNLLYWFKKLLSEHDAELATATMAALIDGIWLRGAFDSKGISIKHAKKITFSYLEKALNH